MFKPVAACGLAAAMLAGAARPAGAAETCFTAFGGSIHYQFAVKSSAFTAKGTTSVPGVLFGALAPCAHLPFWGIVGTSTSDGKVDVLGLRLETVDAKRCGAVDVIVALSPKTLTGPLQLYNERTNFGNSDQLTPAKCVTPPDYGEAVAGTDALGNGK